MPLNLTEEQFNQLSESEKRVFSKGDEGFSLSIDESFFKNSEDVANTLKAKEAEKNLHKETKAKLAEYRENLQKANEQISTLEALGKNIDDEAIKKKIDEAVNVRSQPFIEKESEYQKQLKELSDKVLNYQKKEKHSLLDDKINKLINTKNSKFKREAFQSIKNAAIVSGIVENYNDQLNDFVHPDTGDNFEKWVSNYDGNELWLNQSQGAGAGGGSKSVGNNKAQSTNEIMADYWGGK